MDDVQAHLYDPFGLDVYAPERRVRYRTRRTPTPLLSRCKTSNSVASPETAVS
jgi:hypothetical protein